VSERIQTQVTPVEMSSSFAPTGSSGLLQRKCACGDTPGVDGQCAECRAKQLLGVQRSPQEGPGGRSGPSEVPAVVHEVLASPGQPLDAATRAFTEPRFGHDFSRVKVHADSKAAASAESVNALAYTVGRHIVFNREQYAPHTDAGLRLLAHELAHTIQQSEHTNSTPLLTQQGVAEGLADNAAHNVMRGRDIPPLGKTVVGLARQPLPKSPPDVSEKQRWFTWPVLYFDVSEVSKSLGSVIHFPAGVKKERITLGTFAHWIKINAQIGFDKEQLEERILTSPEFIGSTEVRKFWADLLHDHFTEEDFAKLRGESEQLRKFKSRNYKKPVQILRGFVHAEYSPSKETLTISVPMGFVFEGSIHKRDTYVPPPNPSERVWVKQEITEVHGWKGAEAEEWRQKFIKVVQDTWSSDRTKHTLYCYKKGLESLKAKVVVRVDDVGVKSLPPNPQRKDLELAPFTVTVYRKYVPEDKCGDEGKSCVQPGTTVQLGTSPLPQFGCTV
jgi:hypothetical protein